MTKKDSPESSEASASRPAAGAVAPAPVCTRCGKREIGHNLIGGIMWCAYPYDAYRPAQTEAPASYRPNLDRPSTGDGAESGSGGAGGSEAIASLRTARYVAEAGSDREVRFFTNGLTATLPLEKRRAWLLKLVEELEGK